LVTALVVVPADFQVEAEGQLQPAARRNLFAPGDAVVDEVRVVHGAEVRQGDVLLRMHSPALDLEQSRLSGELQTAQARLVAVRAARSRPQDSADADEQQLASEEEQLVEQIAGLTKQLSVVEQMRKELVVTSPLAGIVLTWNTHESLDARPVKQGQLLLTVADPSGPWHVEIEVPDADAGHVIDAQRGSATPLPVSFLLASDPAVTHHGALERLAQATDTKSGNSAAQGIAVVDGKLPASARAGGRVTARIHCGRQSLGYVWLHDLIDFVRTSIWL
jgi:biotin carboxyl carrier protein